MNHTSQYRTALPHHLHHNQGPALQSFTGRFPPTNLDSVNAVMIPTIGHEDQVQYHTPIQPFHNERHSEQQIKISDQRKNDRNFSIPSTDCDRQENCQENYKPTTSTPNTENQFTQHCSQGSKNCLQCYKSQTHTTTHTTHTSTSTTTTSRNKIMVDVATMTDAEEADQTASWQNVSVPPNTKVAEYLSSLRQFLKMDPRYMCGVCGTGHARREHLERHRLSHLEHRPHVCPACHKAFKRNEHLARHLVTHSGLKTQVCLECGKAFYRKDHLRKHSLGHQAKRIRLAGIHCDSKLPLVLP